MATLQDYRQCSTSGIRPLDLQLIHQLNLVAPGSLVSFHALPGIFCSAGVHPWLQPVAVKALMAAMAGYPKQKLIVNSAYRTIAQQFLIWLWFLKQLCSIPLAAQPGLSNHNSGLALDIENHANWKLRFIKQGWDWLGSKDPPHFDFVGKGGKDLRKSSILAYQTLYNYNSPQTKLLEDGVWGKRTEQAMLLTPVAGFAKTPASRDDIAKLEEVYRLPIASLQKGSSGAEVKRLQELLGIPADGLFGQQTEDAVKRLQLKYGLAADGAVGTATKEVLGLG